MTTVEEHRTTALTFTRTVAGVAAGGWDAPAPPQGWVARDVVRHLVEWLPAFLGAVGVHLPPGPSVDEDPATAWQVHSDGVQTLLEDPGRAHCDYDFPHLGRMPLEQAIGRIYVPDVFLHRWDLARATGQDETLDPVRCAELLAGMEPLDQMLRSSGQYGPQVAVPDGASVQVRLLAFLGRTV